MSELLLPPVVADRSELVARIGGLAARLAVLVGPDHPGAAFLDGIAEEARSADHGQSRSGTGAATNHDDAPLTRLSGALGLSPAEADIVLLSALPEVHEGLAAVLRELHPAGADGPTVGLVSALAGARLLPGVPDDPWTARSWVRDRLRHGALAVMVSARTSAAPGTDALGTDALGTDARGTDATGISASGSGVPFPDRTLQLPAGVWDALAGESGWPADAVELDDELRSAVPLALRAEDPGIAVMLRACARRVSATIVVDPGGDALGAAARVATLLRGIGAVPAVLELPALDARTATALVWCAAARGQLLVLVPTSGAGALTALEGLPGPVVLVSAEPVPLPLPPRYRRPVLPVIVPPLGPAHRRRLWKALLPDGVLIGDSESSDSLPPTAGLAQSWAAARDTATAALVGDRAPTSTELRMTLHRQRFAETPPGVQRIRPAASWSDLVLSPDRLRQLHEAVDQVTHQATVLDRWGFLADRPGRRGVRLLFSGPPGTGKSLAAEVLAAQLGRDLLIVDLSQMVSKWIGETEKNLAVAFDAAERGNVVLFFDEADSLFGRRTDVGDAHDRYANLETAYLLGRLSWFDGVAVLATNLRQNVDQAFARRLEFVLNFDLPDEAERLQLWQHHLPAAAPLAADVDLRVLADRYPVTGALIRNAAVGAAYLAAVTGGAISAQHLAWALRREHLKAGRAYPGPPPGVSDLPPTPDHRHAPRIVRTTLESR